MMTDQPVAHETVHFAFDTFLSAAQALLVVLEDARTTDRVYAFTGLSPSKILKSGLTLQGEVADIGRRVERIPGARRE